MIISKVRYFLLTLTLISGFTACTGVGPTTSLFRPTSAHEQYEQSLKSAKLDRTALGVDWLEAGKRALHDSLKIAVPYRESGYFSANRAFAVGYRLDGQQGDRFLIRVETQGQKTAQIFIDVFSLEARNRTNLVATSKADTNILTWEPRKTKSYLIRIQPELLRSGSYTISITREPALAFPVLGKDSKEIASYFGAPRDGGRRRHEGIDIFAPKGTPAVASVAGIISGVGSNSLGGNVATLRDTDRGISLYYAHLDHWNVSNGQHVSVGDTIGFIGNTGNARTIAPHLHFGIYEFSGAATNPLPFVRLGRGPAKQSLLPNSRLGDSVRVSAIRSIVRLAPQGDATVLRELPKSAALTIVGGTETWLRVEMSDGTTGYIASNTTETLKRPLRRLTLSSSGALLDAADNRAGIIKTLPIESTVDVLAVASSFQLVRITDGQTGWLLLSTSSAKPAKAAVR